MVTLSNSEANVQQAQAPASREEGRTFDRPRWTFQYEPWSPEQEQRVSMEVVSTGSMIEAVGGFAGVVLSILALAGIAPLYLLPITVIVLGIALLFEGGTVAARYWRLPVEVVAGRWASIELAGGMIAEFLAGAAGIALGILALVGIANLLLTTIAGLVFGAALLAGSGLPVRLGFLETGSGQGAAAARSFGRRAPSFAAVAQFVLGAAGGILAILALVGFSPAMLTNAALLILSIGLLWSGSMVTGRIMESLHRC